MLGILRVRAYNVFPADSMAAVRTGCSASETAHYTAVTFGITFACILVLEALVVAIAAGVRGVRGCQSTEQGAAIQPYLFQRLIGECHEPKASHTELYRRWGDSFIAVGLLHCV